MENKFKLYLTQTSKISDSTIKKYISAIHTASKDLSQAIDTNINFFEFTNNNEVIENINLYLSIDNLKNKNLIGKRMYSAALNHYKKFIDTNKILYFLKWNDSNGIYTVEDRMREDFPLLTFENAVVLFYGVIYDDFFFSITDNVFELSYLEVINLAKKNGFFEDATIKLELLLTQSSTESTYKSLV